MAIKFYWQASMFDANRKFVLICGDAPRKGTMLSQNMYKHHYKVSRRLLRVRFKQHMRTLP